MQNKSVANLARPPYLLACSAFPAAFLGTLTAFIILPFLLAAPLPNISTVQSLRNIFLIGYAILLLALILTCWWLLRTPLERLEILAGKIGWLFANRLAAILLSLVLVEVNALAFLSLNQIAPPLTGPLKFLMMSWSFILFSVLLVVNQRALSRWLKQTQGLWTVIGLTSIVLLCLVGLLLINGLLIQNNQLVERLRGFSDYRSFPFYGDSVPNLTLSRDFLTEMSRYKLRWQPYTYWVMEEKTGPYINVEANGLRRTKSFTAPTTDAPRIFFFGGSTMWGEGARDEYTIPSQVARRLNEVGQPAHIYNFGQTGYVSTQDLITFELQLIDGNVPDIAVFYGGFNDTLSGYGHGTAGLSLNEMNRAEDFETGRLLDSGQPVLRPLNNVTSTSYDWSLAASGDGTAQSIVDRYLANCRVIKTLANAYGVRILFVWQPAPFYKTTLTPEEQALDAKQRADYPGLTDLYQQVDAILREEVQRQSLSDFVIISDLFATSQEQVFIDIIHITENGNDAVAQAILPAILDVIKEK